MYKESKGKQGLLTVGTFKRIMGIVLLAALATGFTVSAKNTEGIEEEQEIVYKDNYKPHEESDTLGETTPIGRDKGAILEQQSEEALKQSQEKAKAIREEKERKAEEERKKKEEAERKKKEEAERKAREEAERKAQEESKQQTNNNNSGGNGSQQSSSGQSSSNKSKGSTPQKTSTTGFSYKGHQYSLAGFSGSGQVPQETNNVYRWNDRPSHYLIERISPAGRTIKQVGVGDKVTINGQSYTVHSRRSGVPYVDGYSVLTSVSADITFQTCDITKGADGNSDVTLWWATKD